MAKASRRKKSVDGEISSRVGEKSLPFSAAAGSGWLSGLILFLAVVLAYQPVWWAGFIWDDDNHVTTNPCIVGPLGLKEIWTTGAARFFPMTLTTFWVEHALWGLTPLPYHLVNVLMHGGAAVALWRVLWTLRVPGAWFGAALWALHPVQVESVAWITETKNTQSGLFFLLSILFFLKWLRTAPGPYLSDWNYVLTLFFAALAMTSKSSTVILPLVLVLCAWWMEGRWQWRRLATVGPIALMSLALSLLTVWAVKMERADGPQWHRSWPERIVTAGDAIWFYLGKLIWPDPLMAVYPRWQIEARQWFSYLPLLAVLVASFMLWHNRNSWGRPWFFALGYFLAALLPVMGLIDHTFLHYSYVADHFQYLAGMGPLALAGAGMIRLSERLMPGNAWLQSRLYAGLLLVLGILSWQRAWVYQNGVTLWTDTLAKNPDCWIGQYNLGIALLQRGKMHDAVADLQKAVDLNPNDAVLRNNLGRALAEDGRGDDAIREGQKAVQLNPAYGEAFNNLGNAFAQKGRLHEAITQYQKALELVPNYAIAHNNLGNALARQGKLDEAIRQFQEAVAMDPGYTKAHNNLGTALLQKGRPDEAITQFQEVLQLDPGNISAQADLARAQALADHAAGSK